MRNSLAFNKADNVPADKDHMRLRVRPVRVVVFVVAAIAVFALAAYFWFWSQAPTPREKALKAKSEWQELERTNQPDKALEKLRQYLLLAPKDWAARESLAETYLGRGNIKSAFKELVKVDGSARPDADRLYLLGLLSGQLGRDDKAVDYLSDAVRRDRDSLPYRAELAKALVKIKGYDKALAQWGKALNMVPEAAPYRAIIYAEIGDVHMQIGDTDSAREAYGRGLAVEPANAYLQAQLAKTGG